MDYFEMEDYTEYPSEEELLDMELEFYESEKQRTLEKLNGLY